VKPVATPEEEAAAEATIRVERADLINRAVKLIKPTAERREECVDAVVGAIYRVPNFFKEKVHDVYYSKTKVAKRVAGQLGLALRKVEALMRNPALDHDLRQTTIDPAELLRLARRCEEAAKTPSGDVPPMKPTAKLSAVIAAYYLMRIHAAERETVADATKGSRFCRLAALLYGTLPHGDPNADLSSQCKAYVRPFRAAGVIAKRKTRGTK
jgi:hypothetical protein